MFPTRWGPRTYANVANNGSHPGIDQRSNSQREAMMEGDALKRAAAAKKAFFRMRLDLEGSRKQMGKGNIISFLVNAGGQGSQTVKKKKTLGLSYLTICGPTTPPSKVCETKLVQ